MSTMEAIPEKPVPLTVAEAETMAYRMIKKHHVAIVLLHWFNALTWFAELLSGAALIFSPALRVMPEWYLAMMAGIFGGRANLLRFHIAVGIIWIAVFVFYGVFGWRQYLKAEILRNEIGLDRDDLQWLRIRILLILGRTKEQLPPQGSYNAGQKLYALLVYAAIPVIMLTGIIMSFHLFGTWIVGWAMVVHFLAVGMVVSGLLIHVYMGAVFPEEKPAFYSMITGTVNELYAYRHHFKWWRAIKQQESAWKLSLSAEESATEDCEQDKTS